MYLEEGSWNWKEEKLFRHVNNPMEFTAWEKVFVCMCMYMNFEILREKHLITSTFDSTRWLTKCKLKMGGVLPYGSIWQFRGCACTYTVKTVWHFYGIPISVFSFSMWFLFSNIDHVERKVPKYENHTLRERKVKTLTRNWRDHRRTDTRKLYRDILTGTAVFLNQKRVNVCEHTTIPGNFLSFPLICVIQ